MAWMSSGRSNDDLIDQLERNGLIQSRRVAEAMRKVDRRNYVPDASHAYDDSPQRIGFGATISAPHMHAHAAENLLPFLSPTNLRGAILDVGSGSGYREHCDLQLEAQLNNTVPVTAVFHRLAPYATVVGIDHLQGLVDMSKENLRNDGVQLGAAERGVKIVCGDGRLGSPEHAPFQIIHVGAAAPDIPEPLVDQVSWKSMGAVLKLKHV